MSIVHCPLSIVENMNNQVKFLFNLMSSFFLAFCLFSPWIRLSHTLELAMIFTAIPVIVLTVGINVI